MAALDEVARQHGITFDEEDRQKVASGRTAACGSRLATWPLASRRGWIPFALEWGPEGVELVWGCGETYGDEAFHEQIVLALRSRPCNRLFAVRTPLTAEFVAELQSTALPVRGLVFHMSRCGSTLIAQALKAWRGVRVLSEPNLVDAAITLAYTGNDRAWLTLRGVIAALTQPDAGARDVVFKLDSWHALALTQILERIHAPWLFAYRDPIEVLVSHAHEPGRHTVPGMLPPEWFGPPSETCDAHELLQYAARALGAICAAVAPHAVAANLLNYEELPDALTRRAAWVLNLDPGDVDRARLEALLGRHAKRPHDSFADDRAAKHAAATAEIRSAAGHWVAPHFAALELIRRGART